MGGQCCQAGGPSPSRSSAFLLHLPPTCALASFSSTFLRAPSTATLLGLRFCSSEGVPWLPPDPAPVNQAQDTLWQVPPPPFKHAFPPALHSPSHCEDSLTPVQCHSSPSLCRKGPRSPSEESPPSFHLRFHSPRNPPRQPWENSSCRGRLDPAVASPRSALCASPHHTHRQQHPTLTDAHSPCGDPAPLGLHRCSPALPPPPSSSPASAEGVPSTPCTSWVPMSPQTDDIYAYTQPRSPSTPDSQATTSSRLH